MIGYTIRIVASEEMLFASKLYDNYILNFACAF